MSELYLHGEYKIINSFNDPTGNLTVMKNKDILIKYCIDTDTLNDVKNKLALTQKPREVIEILKNLDRQEILSTSHLGQNALFFMMENDLN